MMSLSLFELVCPTVLNDAISINSEKVNSEAACDINHIQDSL